MKTKAETGDKIVKSALRVIGVFYIKELTRVSNPFPIKNPYFYKNKAALQYKKRGIHNGLFNGISENINIFS